MKKFWLSLGFIVLVLGMQVSLWAQYYSQGTYGSNRFDDFHFNLGYVPFNDDYQVTDSLSVKNIQKYYKQHPLDVDANLAMARYSYRRNNDRNAQKILDNLMTFTDQTGKVYLEYGVMAMKQGNLEKAREWFNKVVQLEPENSKVYLYLAATYVQDDPVKSISYLEKAIQQPNADIYLYGYLARLYQKTGNTSALKTLLTKLNSRDTKDVNQILVIGKLYEMLDDPKNAIAKFEAVLQMDTTISKAVRIAKFSLVMNYSDAQLLKWINQLATNDKNSTLIFTTLQDINSKYQYGTPVDYNVLLELYRIGSKYYNRMSGYNPISNLGFYRYESRNEFCEFLKKHIVKYPKDKTAMILLSRIYMQNMDQEDAKEYFDNMVKHNLNDKDILSVAAEYYSLRQNYSEAAGLEEKALSLENDTTLRLRYYIQLCNFYAQTKDVTKTEECISRFRKEFPAESKDNLMLAEVYKALNQPEKAIEFYKHYSESTDGDQRNNINSQIALANYYAQINCPDEAVKLYQALLDKSPEDFNMDRVLEGLLPIYIKQKNLDQYFATYDSLTNRFGDQNRYSQWTWTVVNTAETKMMRAELQTRLEKRLVDKTLDLNLARVLMQCYQRVGLYNNSLPIYEYLFERYPSNTENINSLFNAYQQKNNWKKVIELGEQYVKKGPMYSYMYPSLIQAYEKTGQSGKGDLLIQDLEKRAKTDKNIYHLLASIYQSKNKPRESIKYYEQLVGVDSSNAQYLMMLANLYSQVSEDRKAIQLYEMALTKRGIPQDSYNMPNLLRLYYRVGEDKKAEQLLQQQLAKVQNDWQIRSMVQTVLQEMIRQNQIDKAWLILVAYDKAISGKITSQTSWQTAERIYGDRNLLPWDGKILLQSVLEAQLKKNPKQPMLYYLLADVYQQNWESYQKVKGTGLWTQAVNIYPNDPEPVLKLAELQNYDAKNRDAQIALYEKALSLREKQGVKDISKNYQIYFNLARLYVQSGRKEQSIQLLNKLSSPNTGSNINYTDQLANIYEQAELYEQAIKIYEVNLKNQNESMKANTLSSMIRCYAALKQYDKIEPLLTQLKDVVNQPYQLEEAYRLLVNMYNQAEKYDKALEMYLYQIKINPQNHRYNGLLNGLVNGNTSVFEDSEKAKKYMDAMNEYLKKNPKEILVQGMIAELSLWMGKVTEGK